MRARPPSLTCGLLLPVFSALMLMAQPGSALAEPLYEQEPCDEITLDKQNGNAVLKTFPLELPGRKVPEEHPAGSEIEVRLLDRPDQVFRVPWESIKRVRLYEDMVLEEGLQLVKDGQFDAAQEAFKFLERKYPKTAGLAEAGERLLAAQMAAAYKQGRFRECLVLLVELHRRNPQRRGLAEAWQRVADHLLEEYVQAGNYAAARDILAGVSLRFPDAAAEMTGKWTGRFAAEGARFQGEATQALAENRFRDAYLACARMLDVWPNIDGGADVARNVFARYPHVAVGVGSAYVTGGAYLPDDWAGRRVRRLLARPLLQLTGYGAQGGSYASGAAEGQADEQRQRVTLQLAAGDSAQQGVTAARAAQPLLSAIDPSDPGFDWGWARALAAVSAPSLFELRIEFRGPQPRPEAWIYALSAALPAHPQDESGPVVHPYRIATSQQRGTHFIAQPGAVLTANQPREVIERHYETAAAGLAALKRGEISLLDRINPWELEVARKTPGVTVEPYGLPTVHCLAFSPERPRTADRRFRRALAYGLQRKAILERSLLAGRQVDGCQVISGPLPRAVNGSDQHGYAYDDSVEDYPHDPALAMVLAGLALQEAASQEQAAGGAAPAKLELVYPADEIARLACQSIQRQLSVLGIPVDLRELPAGESPGQNYDLLYVELIMEEPLVDVGRLFRAGGVAGASALLTAACERVLEAATWEESVSRLHELHRAAHQEVALLPLWQIVEHFAYNGSVAGIGTRPLSLYQNLGQWKCKLRSETR